MIKKISNFFSTFKTKHFKYFERKENIGVQAFQELIESENRQFMVKKQLDVFIQVLAK